MKEQFLGSDNLFVQSLAKGIGLLEALGARPGALSLTDLADLTGMDRSTTQRMTHTLVQLGYIEKGANGRGFVPGRKILDRTFDYLSHNLLIERASPILTDLQREAGERVDLSLFDDLSIIYAWRRQTKRQTFFATLVGRRIPCYCSSGGRAIMSHLPQQRVDDILARSTLRPITPKTETDVAVIKRRIAQARESNYALALEETLLGEIAVGCAILDHDRQPMAALHIAGSLSEWTVESFVQRFTPLAIEAARALGGGIPR
ncbi:IclR family transcriptional regulator [Verminephrobacter eiseniae]|nr:IclR family transcriptional regulator [Verminephrobacter eiseniae]